MAVPKRQQTEASTYTPYNYLSLRGGHVVSSIKLSDEQGNVIDIDETEAMLFMIMKELKAIRIILSDMNKSSITDEDVMKL